MNPLWTCPNCRDEYVHSSYCIPERERRAMPEHTERVTELEMLIGMVSGRYKHELTARIVHDLNI